MDSIITQGGVAIPRLGFGTFRMPGVDAQPVVESAIALGYRHIDTAAMYENEAAVGAAIAASGIERRELFVTTKVWHGQLGPEALHRAFDASLRKLRLGSKPNCDCWRHECLIPLQSGGVSDGEEAGRLLAVGCGVGGDPAASAAGPARGASGG